MATVDHYLPLFGRDFLAATAGWTAGERGHYITLLIVQWEQGALPVGLDRLELVSPGVSAVWEILEPKFPAWDDGLRRNRRLEDHREKCRELKDARSEAGKRGSDARWGRAGMAKQSQTDGKTMANGVAKGIAKSSPPTPTPTPKEKEHTHTPPESDEFRQPGWAADEWAAFVDRWNATERAEPWRHLTPPDGWVDLAATPGWLDRARQAMTLLPSREYFDRPLPVTRFFEFVDRIRAGEFADPKPPPRTGRAVANAPKGGNL